MPTMSDSAPQNDWNVELDILGQQPGLDMYTQLCFCFPTTNSSSGGEIINTLENGLRRLSSSFPWVAGQVVNEGSSGINTGVFRIKPFKSIPPLVVKDYRHDSLMPSMDSMRRAKFPFTMLDESVIAPYMTFPGRRKESSPLPRPVLLLQANFINGGLLLTVLGQHQAMDMRGQCQIMHLLSIACCNEEFTKEEIHSGNLARRDIIKILDDSYTPGSELDDQITTTLPQQGNGTANANAAASAPKKACAYFTFPQSSLKAMKEIATKSLPDGSSYISTDDALSAFVWQSVSRVRLPRLQSKDCLALARAVDVRRVLGISPSYPGIIHNMTYHRHTLQDLVQSPLGIIASELRSALDSESSQLEYNIRALATFLHRSPDKSFVSFIARFSASSDIMLSSWANENCYGLDFGLGLGKPEAVRRPRFSPNRTLIYFMPKTLDGEIAVGIFTREEDMERLRKDEEFIKYANFVG
jgi:hypothetical protein